MNREHVFFGIAVVAIAVAIIIVTAAFVSQPQVPQQNYTGPSTCADGTIYGQCSLDKPLYCDAGELVNDCSFCGCGPGLICDEESGGCLSEIAVKEEQEPESEIAIDFCPYPLCDTTPKIYDLTASNSPRDYTGHILSTEMPSDAWEDYQPLQDDVERITEGLTNDYDKAVAIASWVKDSKTYGEPSPANEFKTVIEIYESPTGLCLDANTLLPAMLRMAGIPARSVVHSFRFHQMTDVYIDGDWLQMDATFAEGEIHLEKPPEDLKIDPTFLLEYYNHFENVEDKELGVTYSDIYLYKRKEIEYGTAEQQGLYYGTLIFPVTAKTLYYDMGDFEVTDTYSENLQPTWIVYWIEVKDKSCLEKVNINNFEGTSVPGFYLWAIDSQGYIWTGAPRVSGYLDSRIPACTYRLHYYFSMTNLNYNDNQLAYQDFEITEDGITKISTSSLRKSGGADQEKFDILVQALEDLPTYEELV